MFNETIEVHLYTRILESSPRKPIKILRLNPAVNIITYFLLKDLLFSAMKIKRN